MEHDGPVPFSAEYQKHETLQGDPDQRNNIKNYEYCPTTLKTCILRNLIKGLTCTGNYYIVYKKQKGERERVISMY